MIAWLAIFVVMFPFALKSESNLEELSKALKVLSSRKTLIVEQKLEALSKNLTDTEKDIIKNISRMPGVQNILEEETSISATDVTQEQKNTAKEEIKNAQKTKAYTSFQEQFEKFLKESPNESTVTAFKTLQDAEKIANWPEAADKLYTDVDDDEKLQKKLDEFSEETKEKVLKNKTPAFIGYERLKKVLKNLMI